MAKQDEDDAPADNSHIGLSDVELAALEDDENEGTNDTEDDSDGDDTSDSSAAKDADAEDDPDGDADDADDEAATAAKPAAATKAEQGKADAEDEGDAAAIAETEEAPEFATVYDVKPVENYTEKMAAFAQAKKDLRTQLTNADIDLDQYEDQKDAIIEQENALKTQQLKAEIAAEQNEQAAKSRWEWEQERFFEDKANAIYSDKLTKGMLDIAVRDLALDPKNAARSANWFLREGDRLVRERIGKPLAASDTAPPAKSDKQPKKPDLSKIPKTISSLPAADINDTGADEFAHLEKLSGMDLEMALAKMSKAQQDRFLGLAA